MLQASKSYCLTGGLNGTVHIPGDKSISHRSLMFATLAKGESHITGLLEGEDVMCTLNICRALGADIKKQANGSYLVISVGVGCLKTPDHDLYCGNSGTTMRLMAGILAGQGIAARLTGDVSLSKRPMKRILDPLAMMGADVTSEDQDKPPLTIKTTRLNNISYDMPMASAQVKSCILLAGLGVKDTTKIIETSLSRDHTENMLKSAGADIKTYQEGGRFITELIGSSGPLSTQNITVPSDPSSAAFFIVAGLIVPGSEIFLPSVMMNPTRIGLITTLIEMGGYIVLSNHRTNGGEPIADITVRSSKLTGVDVPASRAVSMIDEYPILAVAATQASDTTRMNGLAELRIKETDRIAAMVDGLNQCGVSVDSGDDWMSVTGGEVMSNASPIKTHHDHRIAMSFLTLGLLVEGGVSIDDGTMIKTSFPNFLDLMTDIGANITDKNEQKNEQ